MSGLPRGWVDVEVREVVQPTENCDPTKEGDLPFRYVDIGSINNKTFSIEHPKSLLGREAPSRAKRRIRHGDVLFSTVRTYLKNIAVVPDDLDGEITSTGIAVLRPTDAILSDFLFAMVRSEGFIRPLTLKQDGTLYPAITDSDLLNHQIPLPPLAEQKRIVAKLNALSAKSARASTELSRIETLISRYKQVLLSKAFSGELTREWRLTQGLEDWSAVSPETLFKWSSGKNLPSREYKGGPVPVIGGNGVSGYHDTSNINSSTIVIGRVGALCGNVYHSEGPAWITDNAIYAKWISPAVDLQFSVLVYEVADLNKLSGGTGQPYVNQSILNSIEFPLPDVREQHEIVRRIESAFAKVDRLAIETRRALKLLGKLDEAILVKAFRGELVSQDESDESAENLLERIRTERDTSLKVKSKRLKRVTTMPTARDFLNTKLENWPADGVSFQDLRREFGGSYDDLKEAVFASLSAEQSPLQQIFDEKTSTMAIKKRER
ncbi:hypothetical protein ELH77_33380 (plasmid) [Rhizobium ruizarguesonis]|uniref:restriction endonuclease subunit S n=1 Tax=Rhizobium ruizarguesonis TaxID=2081791 RepID=UPI001030E9AA|nr:restriction endonuclease subunit S [Rhizobium ruizarguesonis]TAT94276.1 hypothetical protein ELI53_28630 [Rhizobium ruizarguesonis]TAW07478.1 hypothetical protein ELI20_31795 [Rhizobium ruizarguesonis]TAZ06655.1 hypothetical protein ELH77_33380 [Rhizobium ruizarguesonis]TBD94613.1 hypothetical protein ELH10_34560 [Rhizobium ruizarguesonis]TBF04972.1 hypothetical protein ELG95_32280 [Rhizobium ruizarguesonis]